jgi:hypothetical protein
LFLNSSKGYIEGRSHGEQGYPVYWMVTYLAEYCCTMSISNNLFNCWDWVVEAFFTLFRSTGSIKSITPPPFFQLSLWWYPNVLAHWPFHCCQDFLV